MSIVARILTLMFVTLMLVATVEVNSGLKLRATREAELQDGAMELAPIATLDMDGTLQAARQLLAALAKLPMAADWDAACSVIIATVNNDFEYDFITAVGNDGRILCSSDRPKGAFVANREVLDRVLTSP